MKNLATLLATGLLAISSILLAPSADARFLQVDPIGYEDQMNLYAYVHNDPINSRDPSGRCSEFTCPVNPLFGTPETNAATKAGEAWAATQIGEGLTELIPGMGISDGIQAFQDGSPYMGVALILSEVPAAKPFKALKVTKSGFGVTRHGVNQKINRGVASADELDALKNPLKKNDVKIDNQGRASQRFIGEKAEVAINPKTGKIVSVNPTSTRKAEKLKRPCGKDGNTDC